jgi:UPF0755 protein
MRLATKLFFGFTSLVSLLLILGIFLLYAAFIFYVPSSISAQRVVLEVEEGTSFNEITEELYQLGLIRSKFGFKLYSYLNNYDSHFQPGRYEFKYNMNISQIAKSLATGNIISGTVSVLIPEGFLVDDIEERLAEFDIKVKLSQYKTGDFVHEFAFLVDASTQASLEGYLFPDTYEFKKEATAEDIIFKMLNNFDRKFTEVMRRDTKEQNKSIFEIVTMASMIEKEVPDPKEQKIVSGVLWKRLDADIGLQVDATVVYVIGIRNGRVTYNDLKVDSPYNTYKYKGLPPGPISNPGLSALEAAIYPTPSDYWFYLSKRNGETVFSETLEEHNIAKNKYLR